MGHKEHIRMMKLKKVVYASDEKRSHEGIQDHFDIPSLSNKINVNAISILKI